MQLSISSNVFINFVYISGIFIVLTVLVLMLFAFAFRLWSIKKEKNIEKFNEKWHMIFEKINYEIPAFLPKIKRSEEFLFLKILSDSFELADHNGKQNLFEFASHLEVIKIVLRMFEYDSGDYKMLAIRAAGLLKYNKFEEKLFELMNHQNPLISLLSAQALLKISPKTILPTLIPYFATKQEWIMNKIILILKETNPKDITRPLLDSIDKIDEDSLPKLLKLFIFIDKDKAYTEAKKLLEQHSNPEIISAALHYMIYKKDKKIILSYLGHDSWVVRMHAIKALMNMLEPDDISKIIPLLSDNAWWVRHHAANVIVNQSFIDKEYIKRLDNSLNDEYAKDILFQEWNKKDMNEHI